MEAESPHYDSRSSQRRTVLQRYSILPDRSSNLKTRWHSKCLRQTPRSSIQLVYIELEDTIIAHYYGDYARNTVMSITWISMTQAKLTKIAQEYITVQQSLSMGLTVLTTRVIRVPPSRLMNTTKN